VLDRRFLLGILALGLSGVAGVVATIKAKDASTQAPYPLNFIVSPRLEGGGQGTAPNTPSTPWRVPLESLHETRERPLFRPSRRPPAPIVVETPMVVVAPPPPPPPPPPAANPDLALVGVILGDTTSFALFIEKTSHESVRLRKGEMLGGWTLSSIKPRAATLTNGDRVVTLEFPVSAGSSAPIVSPGPPYAAADAPLHPPPGSEALPFSPPPPPAPIRPRRHRP
jgi:hypothetical protein